MARTEADRDDLFAEAVSYARRVEGRLLTTAHPVLVGFKTSGDGSFYFGPNQVYHFDAAGRLRRAFVAGFLYRSQGTALVCLRRDRTDTETALLRSDMSETDATAFKSAMHAALRTLRTAMTENTWNPLRRHPAEDTALDTEIVALIDTILSAIPWLAPALVSRR